MTKRLISVPTDFSECADRALAFAAGWAQQLDARVELVHLLNAWDQAPAEAAKALELRSEQMVGTGVSGSSRLVYPDNDQTPLEKLDLGRSDWVVMGTHGLTGWRRSVLGSWAELVVREGPRPVITVGPDGPVSSEVRTVVLGMDFSELSRAAHRELCEILPDLGSPKVVFVCARPAPPDEVPLFVERDEAPEVDLSDVKSELKALVDAVHAIGSETEVITGYAGPAGLIVSTARELKADLIALGTHGRGTLGRALVGSIAAGVLRSAACPVYTTRGLVRGV